MFRPKLATALLLASLSAPSASRADILHFPAGFQWCVATAGHQVEGGDVNSDWADWEQGKYASGLPHIKTGMPAGLADDHWNRLQEDTSLLVDLGVGTSRFSIEWSKVEPLPGQYDMDAVEHYRREIELLRENGISPMITLSHYTLPRWVAEKGGWDWNGIEDAFTRYTKYVYSQIAPGNRDFITINEPTVMLGAGWIVGTYPPGKTGLTILRPLTHMLRAHASAYHALHDLAAAQNSEVRVGLASHLRVFDAYHRGNIAEQGLADLMSEIFNWTFLRAAEDGQIEIHFSPAHILKTKIEGLSHTQDFIGVNYYSRDMVKINLLGNPKFSLEVHPGSPVSDLHWEIYPQGIYRILKEVHRRYPDRPVFITENGIADAQDTQRPKFLVDHLKYIHQAIQEGVPVLGYCHWSAMDNVEWDEGTVPRFGLYSVDYSTEARTPRASALLFGQIAHDNAVDSSAYLAPLAVPKVTPSAYVPMPKDLTWDDWVSVFFN